MFEIPSPESIEEVADWVELVVAYRNESLSRSELYRHVGAARGNEPDESFISDVWQELNSREKYYSKSPFKVHDVTVNPSFRWQEKPEYIFCLIFAVFGGTRNLFKSAKQFERVSAEAIKEYISGEARILGRGNCKHQTLKEQIDSFAKDIKEKFVEPPSSEKNDDTVDIVAWKPFGDDRCSQIIILAQCAAGRNWKTKLCSLRLERWKQYIHWACQPIKGFMVPRIISQREWYESSVDAGLLFDRVRIYNLLGDRKLQKNFKAELIEWCTKELERLDS